MASSSDIAVTNLTQSSGGDPGGGDPDPTKTPVNIDGDGVASVIVSGVRVTISWLDDSKPNTTYDRNQNDITIIYKAGRFTVTLTPDSELVATGDGELLPDGTIVVLTAADAADTSAARAAESNRNAHHRGASYALGEAPAVITNNKCVFTFPAEQIAKLPEGVCDLTFATKGGANPAFSGTFALGYIHKVSEPKAPEIALTTSETAPGGGVQASATVTSGDAPQAGVAVSFTITGANNATLATAQKTTDADGKIAAFTLKSDLANATYTVTASATGYATVSKSVSVSNAPTNGGGEEEETGSGGSGGCDAGFGLLALSILATGYLGAKRKK